MARSTRKTRSKGQGLSVSTSQDDSARLLEQVGEKFRRDTVRRLAENEEFRRQSRQGDQPINVKLPHSL